MLKVNSLDHKALGFKAKVKSSDLKDMAYRALRNITAEIYNEGQILPW